MFKKLSIAMVIMIGGILLLIPDVSNANPCNCYDSDIWIHIDLDFWDPWDFCDDCCCCCCWEPYWWQRPYWEWPPCWRRIIRIYYGYNPHYSGWCRYEYYSYPCPGCSYVYVEGRWVYRRTVRMSGSYSYNDIGRDFVRRRGLGSTTTYRTTGSTGSSHSTTRYRGSSSGESWRRTKSTTSSTSSYRTQDDTYRERNTSSARSSGSISRTRSSSSHSSGNHQKRGSRIRTK
ncbi:hypothetical protein DRQ33_00190 [bacterium]|nr:MAG: hypothetical protein DRQ33_00190 [bacterium]